jgi:hypothetical protein
MMLLNFGNCFFFLSFFFMDVIFFPSCVDVAAVLYILKVSMASD